jgi:hypothetical protein
VGKFLLTAYHVFTTVLIFSTPGYGTMELGFGAYHLIAATIIYFHDWIEMEIFPTKIK